MSKRFRKQSHTIYECKYHLIFCPKYRYRVLTDEVRQYQERVAPLRNHALELMLEALDRRAQEAARKNP